MYTEVVKSVIACTRSRVLSRNWRGGVLQKVMAVVVGGGGIDILLIFAMPEVPAGVRESELSRCDRLPERRESQGHEIPCDSNLGERPGARVAPAAVK